MGNPSRQRGSLKCLSAFGFWGTRTNLPQLSPARSIVSNAFRLLGSGELLHWMPLPYPPGEGLKCLSAFGFWGTKHNTTSYSEAQHRLKCLSAFGFWGTITTLRDLRSKVRVSNAFRLLGSWELTPYQSVPKSSKLSQMPFGFWVLGDGTLATGMMASRRRVSNAFRLLGSGGLRTFLKACEIRNRVSNAFRLLGSGGLRTGGI